MVKQNRSSNLLRGASLIFQTVLKYFLQIQLIIFYYLNTSIEAVAIRFGNDPRN